MKKHIVGLFLSCLVLSSIVAMAMPFSVQQPYSARIDQPIQPFEEPAPVWEIGNSWTYAIQDINIDIKEDNQTIHLHFEIDELPLEVKEVQADTYILSYAATISGVQLSLALKFIFAP